MDLVRIVNSPAFVQWVAESLALMFLVGGIAAVAVGAGLFFNSMGTLRLFGSMNRWVSFRRATKPLEVLRDTRSGVMRYRRWLAALFIAGGVLALYGLTLRFDARGMISLFGLGVFRPVFAYWVADSARWILIVGNLIAIGVGIALAFFPHAVEELESGGSRWFSERQYTKGSEAMRTELDHKVATYPRFSGLLMMFFGFVLVGTFGIMLVAR